MLEAHALGQRVGSERSDCRHAVAAELPHWPPGTDVVVRATPRAAERDFAQLQRDLAEAVQAARTGKGRRPDERRSAP